jgi:hypothetical protein
LEFFIFVKVLSLIETFNFFYFRIATHPPPLTKSGGCLINVKGRSLTLIKSVSMGLITLKLLGLNILKGYNIN